MKNDFFFQLVIERSNLRFLVSINVVARIVFFLFHGTDPDLPFDTEPNGFGSTTTMSIYVLCILHLCIPTR